MLLLLATRAGGAAAWRRAPLGVIVALHWPPARSPIDSHAGCAAPRHPPPDRHPALVYSQHLRAAVCCPCVNQRLFYARAPPQVGRKIALQRDRRAVVLVVVDVADFDGSLPRAALR